MQNHIFLLLFLAKPPTLLLLKGLQAHFDNTFSSSEHDIPHPATHIYYYSFCFCHTQSVSARLINADGNDDESVLTQTETSHRHREFVYRPANSLLAQTKSSSVFLRAYIKTKNLTVVYIY